VNLLVHFVIIFFLLALMLSGLKAQGIPYCPWSIKRAVGNTACPLGDHDQFSVGQGVLQASWITWSPLWYWWLVSRALLPNSELYLSLYREAFLWKWPKKFKCEIRV